MHVAELAQQTTRQFADAYARLDLIDANVIDTKDDIRDMQGTLREMLGALDAITYKMDTYQREVIMLAGQVRRHDDQIDELANHADLKRSG